MTRAETEHRAASAVAAADEYASGAKLLHWLIAGFIFALIGTGLTMGGITSLQLKFQLYQLHKSMGVTVLMLMLLRLAWRFIARPPALPAAMPAWEKGAAHATHLALYLLLFAMPLSGWVIVSTAAFNIPTKLYGLVAWPHIPSLAELSAATKKTIELAAKNAHATMGWALLVLVVLHIAAGLRHSLILKDGIMLRMLPRFLRSSRGVVLVIASLAGLTFMPQGAKAQEWAVDKGASSITFEVNAGGQLITGTFKDYQIEIHMDPEEPKEADITAAIDLNSVSTGQGLADQTLTTAEWFDTTNTPVAELRAKSAKYVSDDKFEMRADVKIKGVVKRMQVPFMLEVRKGEAKARAEFTINRLDFKVGPDGPVSGTVVDNNVKVIVSLAAKRLDN